MKYIAGSGPLGAKLVIVGEAPGYHEEEQGRPFVGPAGELLDSLLSDAGVNRGEVYVTNVVKFRPPENDIRRIGEIGITLQKSTEDLFQELDTLKPNCILALGNTALTALTGRNGIKQHRGSLLRTNDHKYKVISTLHPSHLLRQAGTEVADYSARAYVRLDFERAIRQSKFPEYNPPQRTLSIARNSLDLYRFLRQYKERPYVAVDIETSKCIPSCISFAFNRFHAISVPLINMVDEKREEWVPKHELVQMWGMVAQILESPQYGKIGQNFKFDDQKLRRPAGFITSPLRADTMLMAHTLYPEFPMGLDFLCSIWTEEPYYKTEGKEFNPKKDSFNRLYLYNAKDASITYEVYEEQEKELESRGLTDFYFNYINRLHDAYRDMEEVGMLIDQDQRKFLKKKYKERLEEVQGRLDAACGRDVNVASPKQIQDLLYNYMGLPRRKDTSEDTIVALQNNNCKNEEHKQILADVLEVRRIRKTIGTYLNARADYDGRMRTSYRIVGTETGRSSTAILKPPLRPHKLGLAYQTMTKHGTTGADLRSQFIADEGYVYVEIDSSQAEARIVALLAKDDDLIQLFNTTDVHKLTSSWIFSVPVGAVTSELRFVGKTTRHAGNYDMGKRRLMFTVNTDAKRFGIDIQISEWRAGQILDAFHAFSPKIRSGFHADVRQAIQDNDRTLVNPFGRERQFFGRMDHELEKEAYAQIPQSTVADNTKRAFLEIRDKTAGDVRIWGQQFSKTTGIVVEAHDALIALVRESEVDEYLRIAVPAMEREIDFAKCTLSRGIMTIPCECKIGKNYKDLKDYEIKRAA